MPSPDTIRMIGLIAIFALLFLGLFNPFYSLLSYFAVMMTRPGLYYPNLANIRIELLIAIVVLIQIFLRKQDWMVRLKFDYNRVNKYMFLFFLVILASFAQAWDYKESWNTVVIEFVKVYAFYIMILAFVESDKQVKQFLWMFALLTILIDYEGLYLYFSGKESYIFQGVDVAIASKGFAAGHVAAANMQLQCLPIMIYLFFAEKKITTKALALSLSFLSVLGVIASGSRGGFLGLIVIGFLVIYFSERKALSLFVCLIFLFAVMPFIKGNYMGWMESIVSHSDDSATSRITGLINGAEMMIRRPILGVGPGCYPLARKAWFHWGLESHNQFGQVMGDLGLLGTLAWGYFIYYVYKNLFMAKEILSKERRTDLCLLVTGVQIALTVRLFEGMFSQSLYIFFWYAMAAVSVAILKRAQRECPCDTT